MSGSARSPFSTTNSHRRSPTPGGQAEERQVFAGTDAAYGFAKASRPQDGLGHGHPVRPRADEASGRDADDADAMVQAGRNPQDGDRVNGELLAMSGPRNPYPGRLGVIEENALADLILVDGDPIAEHQADRRPGEEFRPHHEGRTGGQGRSARSLLRRRGACFCLLKRESRQNPSFPPGRQLEKSRHYNHFWELFNSRGNRTLTGR